MMDSQRPKRSISAFEYFLYAAMVTETGLAAVIYKVIFSSSEMVAFRFYFAIFYFAFLAWTIAQLAMLHRDRALRPELPDPAPAPEPAGDTPGALGLTGSQWVILVVVFAIAVATFSWALRVLR
jgi:hypothetical protein